MRVVLVACVFACVCALAHADFKNPTFGSQDPWVTLVNGVYYYSESYCGKADICVKSSKTLTGLAGAEWVGVWNAQGGAPNAKDIWAPEIHYVSGGWYIYYAADNGDNNNHKLYVLQGSSPTGQFVEAQTGAAHGQLVESMNGWAIDPDVFTASDGKLYITWSCSLPQRICLAEMSSPIKISSATVFLSYPDQYWETRTAAIQEGPVGYTRNGHTYITYSGSASWTTDYTVGLLTYNGGNILSANSWAKSGPIFDHHGTTYGPGSVVFAPSPDGSEYWNMYHGIDGTNCQPNAYACRDIRMQQMWFDPYGYPVLGYPVNPGVMLQSPAGENGAPAGTTQIADFGDAWGDAAQGLNGGKVAGRWSHTDRFGANSSLGGAWDQIFSPWNPNPQAFTSHVEVQLVQVGNTQGFPKYGFYVAYDDMNNNVAMFLDPVYSVLATHAVVRGADQGWQNANLPSGFDFKQWHSLDCKKSGNTFTFSVDGKGLQTRSFGIANGQVGLVVVDILASYRNLQLYPN